MEHAVTFIKEQIPESDLIFADYESGIELAHYLCEQKQVTYDSSLSGFLVFQCGGHRLISTIPDVWAFTPEVFFVRWANFLKNGHLKSSESVWVVQAGWMVKLDEDLRKEFPEFRDLKTKTFGNNIRFFKLTGGQPMPSAAVAPKSTMSEQR
jgi:hypothetical protein